MTTESRRRPSSIVAGLLLMGFGFLAILSIGLPILVVGVFVLVAGLTGAHRERPGTFWSLAAGIGAFFAGYVLVAPLSCSSRGVVVDPDQAATGEAVTGDTVGATTCTNLLGIDYSGGPDYRPPLWPAGTAAAGSAAVVGIVTRRVVVERHEGGR